MNAYGRRFLSYLALTLALALGLGPFSGTRKVTETGPRVYLTSAVIIHNQRLPGTVSAMCPRGTSQVSDEDLTPYPDLKEALSKLSSPPFQGGDLFITEKEINRFTQQVTGSTPRRYCLMKDGLLFWLRRSYISGMVKIRLLAVPAETVSLVPHARTGSLAQALVQFQEREEAKVSDGFRDERSYSFESLEPIRSPVPVKDWRELTRTGGEAYGAVVAGDRVYMGQVRDLPEIVKSPLPLFDPVRYILAGVLFLSGIWMMRGGKKTNPGFRVSPGWAAHFADVMFVVFGAVGAFGALDLGLVKLLGAIPAVGSDLETEAVKVVSAVMWVPCMAFFAMYTANLATQSLEVTPRGVIRHGPGKSGFAAWEDISGFDLSTDRVLVGRVGILMPRKLQTRLVIETKDGDMSLFEPAKKETKRNILRALREHAPEHLTGDLKRVGEEW